MILTPDDYEEGAALATWLAEVAGDERAVLERIAGMADTVGIEAARAGLVRCAVVTFAHCITPHTPGTPVPVTIPNTLEVAP